MIEFAKLWPLMMSGSIGVKGSIQLTTQNFTIDKQQARFYMVSINKPASTCVEKYWLKQQEARGRQHRIMWEPVAEQLRRGVMQDGENWRRGMEGPQHSALHHYWWRAEDEMKLGVIEWPAALFEAVYTSKMVLNSLWAAVAGLLYVAIGEGVVWGWGTGIKDAWW